MSNAKQRQHVKTTLRKIREQGQATAAEVGINAVEALRLEAAGLIKRRDVVHTGRRGRPAIMWGLTDKAHKRVKRAMAVA